MNKYKLRSLTLALVGCTVLLTNWTLAEEGNRDWLIVPGQRVGVITANTTEQDLRQ